MRYFLLLLSLSVTLSATDKGFNGRWDIRVLNEPRSRVWWLEVEGAGTPAIKGSFVGAPGGDVDVIPEIKVSDQTLEFVFNKRYQRGNPNPVRGVYTAKIVGGKLVGSLEVAADPQSGRKFEGVRAPVIKDKDDGKWKADGQPVELFNGKDFSGWRAMVAGQELGWEVKDGNMSNKAGANNLVTEQKFWNFELHAEYKYGAGSNSGLGLRGRYEVQILDDYGKPAESHGHGALYARFTPAVNASKKPGEWQTLDIRLIGRLVTVTLNGQKIIDRKEIAGLTAIASDCDEALPGPITVQGDHGAVEFRKLTLTRLIRSN
jgi:hypothetical protein